MITTYFNPADIAYACNEIRANEEEPIIYVSSENAIRFIDYIIPWTVAKANPGPQVINEDDHNHGYIGKYKGALIYVTEEVGNLFVIVPRYKEECK